MVTAYVALGSNLSTREKFLEDAIEMLQNHKRIVVTNKSTVYETKPVGYTEQDDFLNMVVEVDTTLRPLELLDHCQKVEQELGRRRVIKWGPRTIDLDILLYNHENMKDERLIIPHPHMQERAFVMVPLADVNGNAFLPNLGQEAREVLELLPSDEVRSVRPWGGI